MPTIEFSIGGLTVEWDSEKAQLVAKRGLSFEEAVTVLLDVMALTEIDYRVYGEERYITIGISNRNRLLVLVWTIRDDRYRLITTMRANAHHQRRYNHAKH